MDVLLYHMNNVRYLREIDFARADFYERTDLYREVCSQGSGIVQGAATIRYRRFIKPLTIFKLTSKVIETKKDVLRINIYLLVKYIIKRAHTEYIIIIKI